MYLNTYMKILNKQIKKSKIVNYSNNLKLK